MFNEYVYYKTNNIVTVHMNEIQTKRSIWFSYKNQYIDKKFIENDIILWVFIVFYE